MKRELLSTWYRSLTADGKTWAEGSDPDEIRDPQTAPGHRPLTFQKMETFKITEGWVAWEI